MMRSGTFLDAVLVLTSSTTIWVRHSIGFTAMEFQDVPRNIYFMDMLKRRFNYFN